MNWYPWLTKPYEQFIDKYQKGFHHNVILIQTNKNLGDNFLIWQLSCWLMCQKSNGFKTCKICNDCLLMKNNAHPFLYKMELNQQNNHFLGIDAIRIITEKLYKFGKEDNTKIIWLPNITQLTVNAVNALLKILEEPPINCWFFLTLYNSGTILSTLRSRCMILRLLPPDENNALLWLKKKLSMTNNVYCLLYV
ncbi:MAG: hypothetical protein FT671_02445 [Pantoea sp. Brub]|nr:hypothetical protein [Pantoea sp. Brub]